MSDILTPPPADAPPAAPVSHVVSPGAGMAWISAAGSLFKASPLMWIILVIVLFIVNIAFAMVPLIGQLAFNLVWPAILAGVMIGCRASEAGEPLDLNHVMTAFTDKPAPLLMLGLLYVAATFAILLVMFAIVLATVGTTLIAAFSAPDQLGEALGAGAVIWLLLAVLVALALAVPLMMAFWFAPQLVQFHGVKPIDAMQMSFWASLKNFLPFLVYGIVMFALLIVAVIPFGLGLLVWVPVTLASMYTSYKDVFAPA